MRKIRIERVLSFSLLHFALCLIVWAREECQVWGATAGYQLQYGQYFTHLLPEAALALPLTVTHDDFTDPDPHDKDDSPIVGVVTRTETPLIPALESQTWWLNSLVWGFCLERWLNVMASLRQWRKITFFRRGVT